MADPNSDKKYSDAELQSALNSQIAQLMSGLLAPRTNPLTVGPLGADAAQPAVGTNPIGTNPFAPTPEQIAAMGPIQRQYQGQYGGGPGPSGGNYLPQGYQILPGAGTFGPQGVMFAGGSPWKVSPHPTDINNALAGLNQSLGVLRQSGLLDKLLGK